ncbi:response regulator [Bacillus sp. FJAT-52991]|uniref:Response regulator n=1 Tax=Bacillus kandeliae TaxID=3129297 RepID=A0ABZ2NAT3_9BACI
MMKVILIEDDPMVQEVNRQFVNQVDGFEVVGVASNGAEGLELVKSLQPELVIVDIYMPQVDGLEVLKQIRTEGFQVDVIAITAASDAETIRKVIQQGAFDYIMKPFKFERIKQALEKYRSYRNRLIDHGTMSQKELDSILFQKEEYVEAELPKGLNAVTLKKVTSYLASLTVPVSAEEVAEGIGLARVTARRYLDYLEKCGKVKLDVQYGGIGRPINRYTYQS